MSVEHTLVGPNWHTSYEKCALDAHLAANTRALALWITQRTLCLLEPSQLFAQKRVGQGGKLFEMLKVQTMDSVDLPLHGPKLLSPTAQAIRRLAFDELVQIVHVSLDPNQPGEMSAIGPRPQLPEEIEHMYMTMCRAGKEKNFHEWYAAYCAMRPGVLGPDSLIGEKFEPGTPEYYDARYRSTLWYYENGSQIIDASIFGTMLAVGAYGANNLLPQSFTV